MSGLSALILTGLLLPSVQFDEPGVLQINAHVGGQEVTQQCRLFAYSMRRPRELALDGPMREPLRLAQGVYRVRVECALEIGQLNTVIEKVRIRSGKHTRQTLKLQHGAVVVQTVRDGGRVVADIHVVDPASGEVLARGKSGNRLLAPVGKHVIRVQLETENAIPCISTRDVKISRGRTARMRLDLSDGTMRVTATRNGKAAPGLVVLELAGTRERLAEFATGHEALVPPGRYDVVVSLESSHDFEGQRLRDVVVEPGRRVSRMVAFTMGSLRVDAKLHGQKVEGRVYLYLPGAPDYFNFAPAGTAVDLSPGRYGVRVVLDDSVPYDAARPRELGVERQVRVRARKREVVALDFTPGILTVEARKNGEPAVAAINVWLHKPRLKLTGGPAGEPIAIASGRYDVDVLFPNGRGGDLITLKKVDVRTGKETRARAGIERGSLTIDTFDQGVRVDAEVRYFKRSSKDPFAVVRGGEAAELPPGVYEIEIVHNGKSRVVSAMRVKPGSWDVRKVEF